jgi:hypothetical protein
MDGFDLDDTLARTNYKQAGFKGLSAVYSDAPVIYTPDVPFVIITARSIHNAGDKAATQKWVNEHQPNCRKIYYVSGSDVSKQKAGIIGRLHLTSYTDNNAQHLSEMKALLPRVKFYIMRDGKRQDF